MSSSGRDINQDKNNDQSKHQPSSSSSAINATVATNISSITKTTALELLEEDDEFEVRRTHYALFCDATHLNDTNHYVFFMTMYECMYKCMYVCMYVYTYNSFSLWMTITYVFKYDYVCITYVDVTLYVFYEYEGI